MRSRAAALQVDCPVRANLHFPMTFTELHFSSGWLHLKYGVEKV